jgi:hypothetical protein
MSNKHRNLRASYYPYAYKLSFSCSDEDYVYLYEALHAMPERTEYNLMDGDPRFLEVWVWLFEAPYQFENRLICYANRLKRKEGKVLPVDAFKYHVVLE